MGGGARAGLVVVAAIVLAGALPTPAGAAVSMGARQIVVSTPGARAIVDRSPFRLTFADGAGRTVLAEARNSDAAPLPIPPTPRPIPLGNDTEARPTLYEPLAFTVGHARDVQYPGGQWNGNELSGTEAGVMYSAGEVVAARPTGGGVRLDVSTSDPTGRRLAVRLTPGSGAAIRVSVRPTPDAGVATMGDSFASPAGEAFRGFGGRHNALDQRGEDFYNWIEQENVGAGQLQPVVDPVPGMGGSAYLFPNGRTATYYVQSLFYSSRGYGFVLDRPELSRWRMASDRPDAWQVALAAPGLDYVVAPGPPARAIATITAMTGRHRVPPAWGVGPQMDRLVRFPNDSAESYLAEVEDDLEHIARGDIRLTGYRIEGWQFFDAATLRRIIARLHAMGVNALLYYRAFVDRSAHPGTDDPDAFDEAVDNGYVATTAAGTPYLFLSNFNAPAALIDFTNPAAVKWWDARLRRGLDAGADGFMEDFGEQVQVDMHFANGETGASMHNRYPAIYHEVTRRFLDAYERAHPDRRPFVYVRSGYNGSARWEQATFPGDETTDWSRSSGLASLTTDMLNRAVGGAYGFDGDIGGYFDVGPYQPTTKELFLRWAEWTALSPTFRLHGSVGAGTHAPWTFDAETVRLYRAITLLHERAVPLILRLWRAAERTGVPPTRPLWLQFPGDRRAAAQDQEWMLGPDVLVAPVVEEGARSRAVYFPAGCWRHGESGRLFRGPGRATVRAPLASLPWFGRCGTDALR